MKVRLVEIKRIFLTTESISQLNKQKRELENKNPNFKVLISKPLANG